MTWEDVVSKGKRRQVGVRDVDCHKGEEVRESKEKESKQPEKVQVM